MVSRIYKKSRPAVAALLALFVLGALAAACPMPGRDGMAEAHAMPAAMPEDCGAMHHGQSAAESPADGMSAFCKAHIQIDPSTLAPQLSHDAPPRSGDAIAVVPAGRLPHGTGWTLAPVLPRTPGTSVLLKHSVIRI